MRATAAPLRHHRTHGASTTRIARRGAASIDGRAHLCRPDGTFLLCRERKRWHQLAIRKGRFERCESGARALSLGTHPHENPVLMITRSSPGHPAAEPSHAVDPMLLVEQGHRDAPWIAVPFLATVRGVDRHGERFEADTVLDNISTHRSKKILFTHYEVTRSTYVSWRCLFPVCLRHFSLPSLPLPVHFNEIITF